MDIATGLRNRLRQILSKLKLLKIIHSFTLKISFAKIDEDLIDSLLEVDALLRKCLEKIQSKPRRAEIRNVICELVRTKNTEQVKEYQSNSDRKSNNKEKKKLKHQETKAEKNCLCEFCGFFFHRSSLNAHILKIHVSQEKLKSNESFISKCNFSENTDEYICCTKDLCPKNENVQVPRHEKDPLHMVDASAEKNCYDFSVQEEAEVKSNVTKHFVCFYEGCHQTFQKEKTLKKHIHLKHSVRVMYQCNKCDKSFLEKGKLNRHVLSHQRGQFQCSMCSKIFCRMDNLRRHVSLHQEGIKSFECRFCSKRFSLKFNRDKHEEYIHQDMEIQCEKCGKKFKNRGSFKVHKRIHEGSSISCSLCTKTFTRKTNYRNHLQSRHKGLCPFQRLFDSFATGLPG